MTRPVEVRMISHTDLERAMPPLVELLCDAVNGGAPLGFLPPLAPEACRDYWRSLRPELDAGSRLLFAAVAEGSIVGSGQLALATSPNALHRGEVQKVFVAEAMRGQGIGRSLLGAMHHAGRGRCRQLLLLSTRRGSAAESFYGRLGYKTIGVIPGYALGADGERYDNVLLYLNLTPFRVRHRGARNPIDLRK